MSTPFERLSRLLDDGQPAPHRLTEAEWDALWRRLETDEQFDPEFKAWLRGIRDEAQALADLLYEDDPPGE